MDEQGIPDHVQESSRAIQQGARTMRRQRDLILRNGRKVKQTRLTDFPKEDLPDLKSIIRGIESTSIFIIVNEALLTGDSSPSAGSKDQIPS